MKFEDIPGSKSSICPSKRALPFSILGVGRVVSFLVRSVASAGSFSLGNLPSNCIPQILKAPSVSPSEKSIEVISFGRGGKTSLNSACPDSGIQNF